MADQPKKAQITFMADLPMKFSPIDIGEAESLPDHARDMVGQVSSTVKAYFEAVRELLGGPYVQLRDIAPIHLSDPGNILVACCEDGVVIRYERKTEKMKILGGWFPDNVSQVAALVSQKLVYCHAGESLPSQLPSSGNTLEFFKQDTAGNRTNLLTIEVSFHAVLRRPNELPAPPNKPYCLLSIHNEIEVQLFGEVIQEDKPKADAQPFLVRSLIRLPVGWECIEVFPFYNPDHWKPEYVRAWAERDLLASVVRRQLREAELHSLDPNAAARNTFRQLLKSYKDLLDSDPDREEVLHQFLRDHRKLLCPVQTKFWSKLPMGSKETDFVFLEATGDYMLVELERSTHKLFRMDGHPTAELNLARGQVVDWKRYIEDNLSTVQRELGLTGISSNPKSLIVIGRTKSLTTDNRRKLTTLENESPRTKIMTYDDVLDYAKTVIENLLGPLWDVGGKTEVYFPRDMKN
jgi:hypothetical protein